MALEKRLHDLYSKIEVEMRRSWKPVYIKIGKPSGMKAVLTLLE